jgi:hypothetical protein
LRILAFDPGGTTGYAKYIELKGKEPLIASGVLKHNYHHTELMYMMDNAAPSLVITERFDYRAKQKSAELISVEYIGIMRMYCQLNSIELVEQPQLKGHLGLWTDDKLKALGLYSVGTGGHANDATRQLLYYLTVTKNNDYWIQRWRAAVQSP